MQKDDEDFIVFFCLGGFDSSESPLTAMIAIALQVFFHQTTTHTHTGLQTHRHRHRKTRWHTCTQRDRHIATQALTERDSQTQKYTDKVTHDTESLKNRTKILKLQRLCKVQLPLPLKRVTKSIHFWFWFLVWKIEWISKSRGLTEFCTRSHLIQCTSQNGNTYLWTIRHLWFLNRYLQNYNHPQNPGYFAKILYWSSVKSKIVNFFRILRHLRKIAFPSQQFIIIVIIIRIVLANCIPLTFVFQFSNYMQFILYTTGI